MSPGRAEPRRLGWAAGTTQDRGSATLEHLGVLCVVLVVLAMVAGGVRQTTPAIADDVRVHVCRVLGTTDDCGGGEAVAGAVADRNLPHRGSPDRGSPDVVVPDHAPPPPGAAPGGVTRFTGRAYAAAGASPQPRTGSRAYPTTTDAADHYGQNGRSNLGGNVVVGVDASISRAGTYQRTQVHGCAQSPHTAVDALDIGAGSTLCRLNDGRVARCHPSQVPDGWTAQLLPSRVDQHCFTDEVPADLVVCQPQAFADDVVQCRYAYPPLGHEQAVLRCAVADRSGIGSTGEPLRYTCSDTVNDATGAAPVDTVNASRRCLAAADDPTGLGDEICEHRGQLYRCAQVGAGTSDPLTNPVEHCSTRALGIGALNGCGTPERDSVTCPWGDGLVRCYTPAARGPGGADAAGRWGLFNCQVLTASEVAELCGPSPAPGRRTLADVGRCEAPVGNGSPLATNPHVRSTRTMPGRTYRGDQRPPEQIFGSGFTAWGTAYDLEDYVTRNVDSGYVGSSESTPVAEQFALERAKQEAFAGASADAPDSCPSGTAAVAALALLCVAPATSGPERARCAAALGTAVRAVLCDRGRSQRLTTVDTYVYEIDPHVAANMMYVPDNLLDPVHAERYAQQREWASVHHIAPGAIVGATRITATYALDGQVPRLVGATRSFVPNRGRTHVRDTTWQTGSLWDDTTAIHAP